MNAVNFYHWGQYYACILFFLFSPISYNFAQCILTTQNQTVNTAGVIVNAYYPGTADAAAGSTVLSVGSKRGTVADIQDGDILLLIQMQGVEINSTLPDQTIGDPYGDGTGGNDRSGYLTNTNFLAGTYEYVVADGPVSAGQLSIRTPLMNSYLHSLISTGGLGAYTFQVVKVANYQNLNVTATGEITALPWDGRTGGIMAFDVTQTFILNGALDASFQGFRGGGRYAAEDIASNIGHRGEGIAGTPRLLYNGSQVLNNLADHSTSVHTGVYTGTSTYLGTAVNPFFPDRGFGAPGNAGGAGYDDGSGGGGGNGGPGGNGGYFNYALNLIARGGASLDVQGGDRLFLGGGGGSGGREDDPGDTDDASSGQPGGGIIIVRANVINGSGIFRSNGRSASAQNLEGGGGGGAGGTILIVTSSADLSGLSIEAMGGTGGSTVNNSDAPGGGGGGGAVLMTRIGGLAFSALASINNSGGATGTGGLNLEPPTIGSSGAQFSSLPGSYFLCDISALPVELIEFKARVINPDAVLLSWKTATETDNAFFTVERSSNAQDFEAIGRYEGNGKSQTVQSYEALDTDPLGGVSYYRLRQNDFDGTESYSSIISINRDPDAPELRVYPNPSSDFVKIELAEVSGVLDIQVYNTLGQLVYQLKQDGAPLTPVDIRDWAPGDYVLRLKTESGSYQEKLIILE